MRELASALGVSPMTPYRYFRDKDDILAAVRARAFDRFAAALGNSSRPAGHLHRTRPAPSQPISALRWRSRLPFDVRSLPTQRRNLSRSCPRDETRARHHDGAFSIFVEEGISRGDPELIGHVSGRCCTGP